MKPGAVAMIRTKGGDREVLGMRDTHGWAHLRDYESPHATHSLWTSAGQVVAIRPVVVLDLNEQSICRVIEVLREKGLDLIADMISEQHPPVWPDEPMNMSTRVTDRDGLMWARDPNEMGNWLPLGSGKFGRTDWEYLCETRGPLEVRS